MSADPVAEWQSFWAEIDADMAITLGIELVSGDATEVVMRMPFKPEISQATGLFAAGALVQLADVASTWLCSLQLRESGAPEGAFPFAVQLSANFVGNTDRGDAVARAHLVSAGRTVLVTQTDVRDENERLLLTQSGTHIARAARPASSASRDR